MLRVLFVSSRYPDSERPYLGGMVERSALSLAALGDVEVEIVAPLATSPLPFAFSRAGRRVRALPSEEVRLGLRITRPRYPSLPGGGVHPGSSLARRLRSLLPEIRKRFAFDVVAAQFAWPEGPASIAAAHSIGVPVTVKARGIDLDRWSRAGDLRLPRLDSADGLLAVSEATKARMAGLGLPPETIAIHRTGLDHSLFYVGDREAAKATLGIRGPLILSAGNLLPNKRHDLAIEAVARLEGFVLIIAGGGPEGEKLKRLAVRLGVQERVKFLGPVPHPDMPNIYRAADATLHTSRREGLSNVWVESIACGTPVIATEADGADETIVEPASGRIVSPDGDAVAAALDWVIAARHDPALVAKAARRFDWSRHGQELEEHFRRVVTAAPSRNAD